MPIVSLSLHPHISHQRQSLLLHIQDKHGRTSYGEIAPLAGWSQETLDECLTQIHTLRDHLLTIPWTLSSYTYHLRALNLLPAVCFGLESALLSLLDPLPTHSIPISALLMGSVQEILAQAALRSNEGYTVAKLKIGNLSPHEATTLIHQLKPLFRLRIDVNRAWDTQRSMQFFSQFSQDSFEYVEEPFSTLDDLVHFPHPIAIDESLSKLSLHALEQLPTLRALIYKPTIRGGMVNALPLLQWARERDIDFVLSSSFESDVGLTHIASMAYRLSSTLPIGLGTLHYLDHSRVQTANGSVHIQNT